ncbi:hypothetical protein [Aurantiacibacter spongiae]|uniref:Secreted protein n=1 Tax=Aurantiacibacter spongiae TaxID=2488860 RepID=A0A3N5CTB4_9SPHN|nr:hypothetical protein [Aurantiacibacter spongiae]RPF71536.1 hypothetical protein EG799_07835 [Aurantiacibacter spongiae]
MTKNILAGLAATTMVFAPIAAQAGTRAIDSDVSLASLDRAGADYSGGEEIGLAGKVGYLLALLIAAGVVIVIVTDGDEDNGNASPGAN